MAISKIKSNSIADDAISEEHLDVSIITDNTELAETANDADVFLVYDTDAAGFKKVTKANISPTGPSITTAAESHGSGYLSQNESSTFTVTGTNFGAGVPRVSIYQSGVGTHTDCSVVTRDSATQLTCTVTAPASGDYFIRVENPDGLAAVSSTALLQADPGPIWTTSAGSLGSVIEGASVSFSVAAATTDSSVITFSETTSVLTSDTDTPATTMNLTLNSSTGAITGTAPTVDADTTYTFTLRATDTESQTADRQFSITVTNSNWFGDESDGELDTTP